MALGNTWIRCWNQGIKWTFLESGIIISNGYLIYNESRDGQGLKQELQESDQEFLNQTMQDFKDSRITSTKIQSCGSLSLTMRGCTHGLAQAI